MMIFTDRTDSSEKSKTSFRSRVSLKASCHCRYPFKSPEFGLKVPTYRSSTKFVTDPAFVVLARSKEDVNTFGVSRAVAVNLEGNEQVMSIE